MKNLNLIFLFTITCLIITGCKNEPKKELLPAKKESISLAISGMTCEIGCAKTIESKLSKKEGVLNAKVIFTDSIANIEYDANATSKKDLIAFVDGIAGGDLYKASETIKKSEGSGSKTSACCKKDEAGNMTCLKDCKMACCANKKV